MKLMTLLLAMFLVGSLSAQAQTQNKKEKQEVVKLKNGHRVRGKIVQYAPLESLVIQEDDGTLQTIYWDKIKQITKEDWQPQQTLGSNFTPGQGPQKGYRGFVDLEYYVSIDAMSKDHYGFSTAHGYQFKPWLFVGAGAGLKISHGKHFKGPSFDINSSVSPTAIGEYIAVVNSYFSKKADFYMFPVFADVRLDLLKHKYIPYLDCRAGYTFGNKAFGVMFNPSLGCRIGLNSRFALNASLGYSMQSIDIYDFSQYGSAIWHYTNGKMPNNMQNSPYHCMSFKLGIEF